MATRIELINVALDKLDEQPLEFEGAPPATFDSTTIDPEDRTQRITAGIYPQVRASLLNAHTWSWATGRSKPEKRPAVLNSEGDPTSPEEDSSIWPFPNRYRLPHAPVGNIRAVYDSINMDRPRPDGWTNQGFWLYTSFELGFIEDQRLVDESQFPTLFQTALTDALAAAFAIPIAGDLNYQQVYKAEARQSLEDAMAVDAQSKPADGITSFGFLDARVSSLSDRYWR